MAENVGGKKREGKGREPKMSGAKSVGGKTRIRPLVWKQNHPRKHVLSSMKALVWSLTPFSTGIGDDGFLW